jgi:hypothetical protein
VSARLVPLIAVCALLSLGAGQCGAPPDEQTGAAGTGGPAPGVCDCPAPRVPVAHLPLECLCTAASTGALTGAFLCSRSVADLAADARCDDGKPAFMNRGCGKTSYEPGGGFAGIVFTYGASSREPIGVFLSAATPFGPCATGGVTSYVYGEGLFDPGHPAASGVGDCATITGCVLCGPSDVPGPRCQ